MDTSSTLLGLGLLILFMAPIGYLLFDQSFKEKQRAKRLAFISAENGLRLSQSDFLPDFSLGIDTASGKLLVLKKDKKKERILDYSRFKKIELLKHNEEGKFTSLLDDVREILLTLKTADGSVEKIIFYTEEEHPVTEKDLRLQMAGKWQKIISSALQA